MKTSPQPLPAAPSEKRGDSLERLSRLYAVTTKTIRRWEKLGAPFASPEQMPVWIAALRTRPGQPKPERVRVYADCRQMTPEQKREHRLTQKRADYARTMADPARREQRNADARQRWEATHGPSQRADLSGLTSDERRTRQREQQHASRARHKDDPERQAKQRAVNQARVAQKAAWRRAHAADLNARRRADRQANPGKYHAYEQAARQRRRDATDDRLSSPSQKSQVIK